MPMLMRQMLARYLKDTDDGSEPGGGGALTDTDAAAQLAAQTNDKPEDNPRLSAMEAIAQRNEQEIETDLAAQGMKLRHEDPAATPAPPAAPAPGPTDAPAPDQVALQLGNDPVPIEKLDSVKVKMTVAGKERVMTVEEIRREAQLDGAARDRFRQATELLDQLRATQTAAPAGTPAGAPAAASPPAGDDAAPTKPDIPDVAAKAQQIVSALMEGNEQDAIKVLTEALSEGRRAEPATPKTEDLITALVPAVEQQLSRKKALEQFAAGYSEIVKDPHLAQIADLNFAEIVRKDPNKSFADALKEAGDTTRDWMKRFGMKPATEPAAAAPIQSRSLEARKQEIDTVSGLSTKAASAEPPVPTVSDVIAEMRASRLAA